MAKPIEKIIHEAERFHHKGHFIYLDNFKKRLESSGLNYIVMDCKTCLVSVGSADDDEEAEEISAYLNVAGVTLKYFYSPGLGSFPNPREKITAYGSEEDILNLEDKLSKAGIPIK